MSKKQKRTTRKATPAVPASELGDAASELHDRFLSAESSEAPAVDARTPPSKRGSSMTIEEFAQTKLPSKRVVPLTAIPDISASRPDSISPDLADLRRKYFGDAEGSLAGAADAISRAARPTADTGIVLVAPSTPTADAGTSQVKAVVFSDGEESGRQG